MRSPQKSSAAPPALEARQLHKVFGQGDREVKVLTDVSFSLQRGKLVAVLGSSGSGKSTLLNILGLLSPPDRGQLVVDGHDVSDLTTTQRSAFRLGRVAFVFQAFHLIDHKTVAENIELPLIYASVPKSARKAAVHDVLRKLGMEHRAEALPATLSGGEKQRVAIGRALVTKPALLLCDEPTGSLDSARSQDVLHLLRQLTGPDQATVIVTHDAWVSAQCDDTIRIEDGRVISTIHADDPPIMQKRTKKPKTAVARWIGLGVREAFAASHQRARRNVFTMLGVALGVASLVLTVGFSATLSAQLSDKFNLFMAQRVTLSPSNEEQLSALEALTWQDSDSMRRLSELNGVEAAGVLQDVSGGAATISLIREDRSSYPGRIQAPIMATSVGGLTAQGLEIEQGRLFDAGHISRGDRVAVIGESLMNRLERSWTPGMTLFVNNRPFAVIGIVREDLTSASSLASVYIPLGLGLSEPSTPGNTVILLKTAAGAASQITREAPTAWSPAQPNSMTAAAPPEPETLRQAVDTQQRDLMLGMSAVTLIIGAVGIMNTFLVAVLERRREIGLRMALGSTPTGMMAQFATEAILTSATGAVLGVMAAINILAVACLIQQWTPVISIDSIALGLGSGVLIGVIAGVYPALKASRIDPVLTLAHS